LTSLPKAVSIRPSEPSAESGTNVLVPGAGLVHVPAGTRVTPTPGGGLVVERPSATPGAATPERPGPGPGFGGFGGGGLGGGGFGGGGLGGGLPGPAEGTLQPGLGGFAGGAPGGRGPRGRHRLPAP